MTVVSGDVKHKTFVLFLFVYALKDSYLADKIMAAKRLQEYRFDLILKKMHSNVVIC